MKRSQWILIILGVFCVATWLGCGDDDDDDDSGGGGDKGDMVGTWRIIDDLSNQQIGGSAPLMAINSNGTWTTTFTFDFSIPGLPAQSYAITIKGTCSRSGDKVTGRTTSTTVEPPNPLLQPPTGSGVPDDTTVSFENNNTIMVFTSTDNTGVDVTRYERVQ